MSFGNVLNQARDKSDTISLKKGVFQNAVSSNWADTFTHTFDNLTPNQKHLFDRDDYFWLTLLSTAIRKKHKEVTAAIIEKMPDLIFERDSFGENALHIACKHNNPWFLKQYLHLYKREDFEQDKQGLAQILTNQRGTVECLEILNNAGFDMNATGKAYSQPPLHIAILLGYRDEVEFYLSNVDLDFKAVARDGYSLLSLAEIAGDPAITAAVNEAYLNQGLRNMNKL